MKSTLSTNFYEILVKNLNECKELYHQYTSEGNIKESQYYLGCFETLEMLIDGYELFHPNKNK
jgi:hypothetical protein